MPRNCNPVSYFWSFVEKTENCWMWTGGFDGKGYGRIYRNGKRTSAHRAAYELTNGKIEGGLFACHKCDNKKCVNPAHIFLGTQKDNMRDWTTKGLNKAIANGTLSKRGNEHWMRTEKGRKYLKERGEKLSQEFNAGKRIVLRDSKGKLLGTKKI